MAMLPKSEPELFYCPDLTKYRSFIQTFTKMIEERCGSDSDRLYYLEKYTRNGPLELKSCNQQDATQGYRIAKDQLEKEYGNTYHVANAYHVSNAYLTKLEKWPAIKPEDGKALRELSIYLQSCANCMKDIKAMNQLNIGKEMLAIVDKLPYGLRSCWRDRTLEITRKSGSVVFADLVAHFESASFWTN